VNYGSPWKKLLLIFGIHPMTLSAWSKRASVEEGVLPGISSAEFVELCEPKQRMRLFEQESEVLKRALADFSWGSIPGKGFTRS